MSGHAGDERLGPYRLRERLGEGGMGVVYLAADQADRPVAIKVLRPGVAADATARRRLAHEVATMRRVASAHVAEVLDADVDGDPPYIVTQYVPGKTLDHVVATDGPLAGPALASLAAGLADALVAVHAAGVVHRDLKPGNVMLVDGAPVVIDFGIAQATDVTRLTLTGMFMGTPGYLAPEVIEGKESGPAADIHSWGATMAFAATGRPPFGTGTFEAIFYRIVHGQPDLDAMPGPLVPLVLRALARDPARRPSAAELAASLAGLDPVALAPAQGGSAAASPAAAALNGGDGASQAVAPAAPAVAMTAPDQSLPVAAAAAGLAGLAGPAPEWAGTRPLTAHEGNGIVELLPPVRYGQPPGQPLALRDVGPAELAGGVAASRPFGPVTVPGSVPAAGAGPHPAGEPGRPARQPAAIPESAGVPLVLATIVIFVAASIVLPVAGAATVLALLIMLRAADLVVGWLGRRRAGTARGGTGVLAGAALVPWAICRSILRFVLLAPLALLCAAGATVISVTASGASQLPKTLGFAAGALVACYCLGPGSAACRRPMSMIYGKLTRSRLGMTTGYVAIAAIAMLSVGAAAAFAPGYWPALHLGQQLQNAPLHDKLLSHLPGNLGEVGRRLISWVGHRI